MHPLTSPGRVVIIGAGMVGLAAAFRIQEQFPDFQITVLEKEDGPAQHQSGHNSGVIHSGIYYKPGSLKAKNCLQGYADLLEFCKKHDVPHQICGKLIVASDAHEAIQLQTLLKRAEANGLKGVSLISAEEAKEKEPYVAAHSALWVPQTGIVSFPAVAKKLTEHLLLNGAEIYFSQKVRNIRKDGKEIIIECAQGTFKADVLINCAGLFSDQVARMAGLRIQHRIIPFRGEYFKLKPQAAQKVNGLIYPVPNPELPFLGVHLTRMISGEVEAGPNAVLAWAREAYEKGGFSAKDTLQMMSFRGFYLMGLKFARTGYSEWRKSASLSHFTKSVQKLMPSVNASDLEAAPAGVRAQAVDRHGQLIDDFLLLQTAQMIHVCNAPSPAATSALSIGRKVADLLREMFGKG